MVCCAQSSEAIYVYACVCVCMSACIHSCVCMCTRDVCACVHTMCVLVCGSDHYCTCVCLCAFLGSTPFCAPQGCVPSLQCVWTGQYQVASCCHHSWSFRSQAKLAETSRAAGYKHQDTGGGVTSLALGEDSQWYPVVHSISGKSAQQINDTLAIAMCAYVRGLWGGYS